jgi:hypothetical protein
MKALTEDNKEQRKVKRSSKGACYTRKTRYCGFTGNNEDRDISIFKTSGYCNQISGRWFNTDGKM